MINFTGRTLGSRHSSILRLVFIQIKIIAYFRSTHLQTSQSVFRKPPLKVSQKCEVTHVIFDMDGLLLNTQSMYSAVSKQLLAEHGKQPDFDFKMKVNSDQDYKHPICDQGYRKKGRNPHHHDHNDDQGYRPKGRGGGRYGRRTLSTSLHWSPVP